MGARMFLCVYICVFGLYSLTFLWGCETRSQIIVITIVIMKTLRAANRATGAYSDNVSSGWSETRQHTWRGVKDRQMQICKKKKKRRLNHLILLTQTAEASL